MAESTGTASDVPHGSSDPNYRKAKELLERMSQEMYEIKGSDIDNRDRLGRMQQKATDITKVFELVEHVFENVERDDWQLQLAAASASLERKTVMQENSREMPDAQEPTVQKLRPDEPAPRMSAMPAETAAYRQAESYHRPSEPLYQPPYEQPHADPRGPLPPSAAQQQNLRPGSQPGDGRQVALRPRPEQPAMLPMPKPVEDENYEVPSNISFNHGPNFSDCIASLELSNTVHDLEEAQEDLVKVKGKLRKAEEHDDAEKVDRYRKRATKTEQEVRELEGEHWRREVEPLRRAYRFEISRCLRQLDVAMKYTEALRNESNSSVKAQKEGGQMETTALHDMKLLQEWLGLCLRQPKTWRKDNLLLVGLIKGHPGSSLKDPEYVDDLLHETAQADPSSTKSRTKKIVEDSETESKIVQVTPDLLEGMLNGQMPKEVAESIQECPECKGQGGDLEHAKICSECEGEGKSKDSEDGAIEMCPKCRGRGFRLSKKYLCPVCDGFKIVLRIPGEGEASPAAPEPNRRSSTKHASFEPEVSDSDSREPKRRSSTKHTSFEPEVSDSDSRKSRKHRDYSSDEAPRSASTGPSRKRRQSESRQKPDPAQSITAALSAVFEASKEPGSWKGEKGMRVLNAAIGAAGGGGGGVSDSGKSDDDEEEEYEKKPRRKRRGSTRH